MLSRELVYPITLFISLMYVGMIWQQPNFPMLEVALVFIFFCVTIPYFRHDFGRFTTKEMHIFNRKWEQTLDLETHEQYVKRGNYTVGSTDYMGSSSSGKTRYYRTTSSKVFYGDQIDFRVFDSPESAQNYVSGWVIPEGAIPEIARGVFLQGNICVTYQSENTSGIAKNLNGIANSTYIKPDIKSEFYRNNGVGLAFLCSYLLFLLNIVLWGTMNYGNSLSNSTFGKILFLILSGLLIVYAHSVTHDKVSNIATWVRLIFYGFLIYVIYLYFFVYTATPFPLEWLSTILLSIILLHFHVKSYHKQSNEKYFKKEITREYKN